MSNEIGNEILKDINIPEFVDDSIDKVKNIKNLELICEKENRSLRNVGIIGTVKSITAKRNILKEVNENSKSKKFKTNESKFEKRKMCYMEI